MYTCTHQYIGIAEEGAEVALDISTISSLSCCFTFIPVDSNWVDAFGDKAYLWTGPRNSSYDTPRLIYTGFNYIEHQNIVAIARSACFAR
jgi:hypothetical protein